VKPVSRRNRRKSVRLGDAAHGGAASDQQVFVVLAAVAPCTLATSFLLPNPASERGSAKAIAPPVRGND
jgi:hypothetical protein